MKRSGVYKLIDGEREYQDVKWTGGLHPSPEEWLVYIQDYLLEAQHFLAREAYQSSYPKAMANIRKIAALCVAAMEQIDTPSRGE